jgi:thiazole synthase ThiGH ThiG subunit
MRDLAGWLILGPWVGVRPLPRRSGCRMGPDGSQLATAGADGIAVITAIMTVEDIRKTAAAFDKALSAISKVVCTDYCAPR